MDIDNHKIRAALEQFEYIKGQLTLLKESLDGKSLMTKTALLELLSTHVHYISNKYRAALKTLHDTLEENAIAIIEEARARDTDSITYTVNPDWDYSLRVKKEQERLENLKK